MVTSAAALRRRSGESYYDDRLNTIWVDDTVPNHLLSSVVAHELNHFLVHTSTPYGWFLDECLIQENKAVLSYCLDYYHRFPRMPITIPLYEVAKLSRQGERFQEVVDLCNTYVKPWSHLIFLRNLLEGEDVPEVTESTFERSCHSFNLVERRLRADELFEVEMGSAAKPRSPAELSAAGFADVPGTPNVILPNEQQINIGAKHVFEGIATQHETKESILSSLKQRFRLPYWTLWAMTVWKMGKERVNSPKEFEQLINTFYAICDLALFMPAGWLYGRLRTANMGWYDVQPGGRFITALEQAVQLGWIEDLEKDMLPYQEWLSELLHWPSPKQFLRLGATLKAGNRSRRHAEACQIRLENHSAFIVLGKEFEKTPQENAAERAPSQIRRFFRDHRPMIYMPKLGQLVVRNKTTREPLSQLLDWFLHQFNCHVMEVGPFNYEDLLPRDVKYQSLWSNVKSRKELIDLLQQAIPLLTPDRFTGLRS
jgi:hypothetical protein